MAIAAVAAASLLADQRRGGVALAGACRAPARRDQT